MMKKALMPCMSLLLLAMASCGFAAGQIAKGPLIPLPILSEQLPMGIYRTPQLISSPRQTDDMDIVGDTIVIGTTWYEIQHNGTIGRMVVKDELGYLHFVWTKGFDATNANRHVFYNYVDPLGIQGWPGSGCQVDISQRAGFTCLAVGWDGFAFPAFHQQAGSALYPHSAVAGASGVFELPWFQGQDLPFIWPRICMKQDGQMLIVSTEFALTMGTPMRQTWSLGSYDGFVIAYTDQELLEYTMTVAAEVAASKISNRIAAAWTCSRDEGFPSGNPSQYNNDIHMMIDDDGLNLNFDNWFNLTNFLYPDASFWPDTLLMNGDTLRAYTDISLFFDQDDYCHAAFTTLGFYQLDSLITTSASLIWHWSEADPNEFTTVANGWINGPEPGIWNRYCQRPSLGQDPATGYLYCLYQRYDPSTVSAAGYPSGEVYISVSTDGGHTWSVGTNVSNTLSPNGAAAGQCLSELCPSLAELVDGYCHITYILDRDAGNSQQLQPEGAPTLNQVIYHRVPVDSIATSPLVPQFPEPGGIPFHVQHIPDTTQISLSLQVAPAGFALEQNIPNPFNPTTTIRFSLASLSNVELSVYSLRGELVATIVSGVYQAGTHTAGFNASRLASGVYICRLQIEGKSLERKMVLIK